MKNKKMWIIAAIALLVAASVFAQKNPPKVTIEASITVAKINPDKDYFKWSPDVNGKAVTDKFGATATRDHDGAVQTGASIAHSTEAFNSVYTDKDGKTTIPQAVRHLMLYAVSSYDEVGGDYLTVIPGEGKNSKQLTIRFVHRNMAYEITTDAKGIIDVENSSKSAVVADQAPGGAGWLVKKEFLRTGGNQNNKGDIDWSKVPLQPQKATSTSVGYKGTLAATYSKGVLAIKKGTLTLK